MTVVLELRFIEFKTPAPGWWREPRWLATLLEGLRVARLLERFGSYKPPRARRRRPLVSLDELVQESVNWRAGVCQLNEQAQNPDAGVRADLEINDQGFGILLSSPLDDASNPPTNMLDQLITFVISVHASFSPVAWFGPTANVSARGIDFRRLRPPRMHPQFGMANLLDFFCREFHTQHPWGSPDEFEKLSHAPLPAGVLRWEADDLLILRWVEDLTDVQKVAERLTLHEQWFARVLKPPVHPLYNELGDYELVPMGAKPHPPLTLYEADHQRGYQAVFVQPDGRADEEALRDMHAWVQARSLPDGTPLRELYLIAPNREGAIRLRDRTMQIGAKAVYYPGEGNTWFDPFPPGLWLEREEDTP